MPLCRLIYFSRAVDPSAASRQLHEIALESNVINARHAITGSLTLLGETFIQYVEGRRGAINALWSCLQRDPRHCGITLVDFSEIDERQFTDWSMCTIEHDTLWAIMDRFLQGHSFDPATFSSRTYGLLFKRLSELQPTYGRPAIEVEFGDIDDLVVSGARQDWHLRA
jgi:Sensors of blue-light using FAD